MSNLLTLLENKGIRPKKVSSAYGGEYASHCPCCGDDGKGKDSDRFHIWPYRDSNGHGSGRYWCRKCGASGDNIQFLIDIDKLTFREACTELGISLPDNQQTPVRTSTPTVPRQQDHQPREYPLPSEAWIAAATSFLADCQMRLAARSDAMKWLADRGIGEETAQRYGLGYNESSRGGDRYRPRSRWGLPSLRNDDGKEKKLWLPRGWVVPLFDERGRVIQLRVRRLNEDITRFASDIKYLMITGSCPATMVLHPDADAHAVVESGLDAVLLAGLFSGALGAVTTWNASARPDVVADAILQRSDCVLDCLDFDAAGSEQHLWWEKRYRRHKRWPVPLGKDPGDAYKAGVDLRAWILAGLPTGLAMRLGAAEFPVSTLHGECVKKKSEKDSNGRIKEKAAAVSSRDDELRRKIEALPPIMRAEVEAFKELLDTHPLGAWMSGDGLAAGPICRDDSWRQTHWDVFGRFKNLFYGPAHGIICDLWEKEFKRTGKSMRKW